MMPSTIRRRIGHLELASHLHLRQAGAHLERAQLAWDAGLGLEEADGQLLAAERSLVAVRRAAGRLRALYARLEGRAA